MVVIVVMVVYRMNRGGETKLIHWGWIEAIAATTTTVVVAILMNIILQIQIISMSPWTWEECLKSNEVDLVSVRSEGVIVNVSEVTTDKCNCYLRVNC